MKPYMLIIKIKYFLMILIFALALSSCELYVNPPDEATEQSPLFSRNKLGLLSLQSGNLHHGGFLSSDSSHIFFRYRDSQGLSKSDYDGQNNMALSSRAPGFINITGDMVFYTNGATGGPVFKVNIMGEGETIVVNANAKYLISRFDYIYYINYEDSRLYRAKHDGSNITRLTDFKTDEIIMFKDTLYILNNEHESENESRIFSVKFNILNNMSDPLVYDSDKNDNYEIYKFSKNISAINADNENLYFLSDYNIFIFSRDARNERKTDLKTDRPFIVSDSKIFFINREDRNRIYSASAGRRLEKRLIVNDITDKFVVCGNTIYYKRENNNNIYKNSVSGGISSKIT